MLKKYTTTKYKFRRQSPDKVVDSRRNRSHRGSTTTRSSGQTQKLGQNFAKEILLSRTSQNLLNGRAVVIGLQGNLGGGKTTFLQGFARGLGIKEKILSPTYVICKKFSIPNFQFSIKSQFQIFKNFYHLDCYRINKFEEILELGFESIIFNPENIVAIEWPEKIYPVEFAEGDVLRRAKQFNRGKKVLSRLPSGNRGSSTKSGPKNIIKIEFKLIDKNKREITFDTGF